MKKLKPLNNAAAFTGSSFWHRLKPRSPSARPKAGEPAATVSLAALRNWKDRPGQALIEFVFVAAMLLLIVFGLIDFCRAISTRLVITNLSREGSNLASRNTPITNAVDAVIAADAPLDINAHGRVIITAVANVNGNFIITNQLARGGITTFDAKSKVGLGVGTPAKSGWIPSTPQQIPQSNQTVYVTEVFYEFEAVTPVGKFLGFTLPSPLYDVAYF